MMTLRESFVSRKGAKLANVLDRGLAIDAQVHLISVECHNF